MVKTSTTKKNVNSSQILPERLKESSLGVELDAFFGQIKPNLDQLKRNPSMDTIQRILEYSKKK